jgi:predicted ATPase/class 3 adenylate cyclase
MNLYTAYIPMDRRQALAEGGDLAKQTSGAGLFADISGFTPLTEALANDLGPQRGAEELTVHLNMVYDALINVLHQYRGSVIGFSGDAITCWFDGDDGLRATACALGMQREMEQFATVTLVSGKTVSLSIKTAISTGTAMRFVVGDPEISLIDVLSGAIMDNLAAAEHMAGRGETVLDPASSSTLGARVSYHKWVTDPDTGERYGVVDRLEEHIQTDPWPEIPDQAFDRDQARSWVLRPVFNRLAAGQGDFLAELRPAVALFLRFRGIDFEADEEAETKLGNFVRLVQRRLERYEGTLVQLTIGDKGSYMYAAFGAPLAHEDDPVRAAQVALELQSIGSELDFITSMQIGITRGRMRTGAYGSTSRRTYGVLGDAVNLSARLMQKAEPGQILISQKVFQSIEDLFICNKLPDIQVKGKSDTIEVYRLVGRKDKLSLRLKSSEHDHPMVGRQAELKKLEDLLEEVQRGSGQIAAIVGEAGMGKTRLIAELLERAEAKSFSIYGGECLSYGTRTNYHAWQNVWRGLLNIDPGWEPEDQISALTCELELISPTLMQRLPLLGVLFNLSIPDTDLTRPMDSKLRKSSLESLLLDSLRAKVKERPTLIVLENIHWLDPLSHDLLEIIAKAIGSLPVMIVMAYRPFEVTRLQEPRVSALANYHQIMLEEITADQAKMLITHNINLLFGSEVILDSKVIDRVIDRSQGNPFYIEELLALLKSSSVDPRSGDAIERLNLPGSLHSLILSRMDQMNETNRTTLKVASVIGRSFEQETIEGVTTIGSGNGDLKSSLSELCHHEFIDLERELEDQYIFKHIVTQEVAYESLPFGRRAILHDRIGQHIENKNADHIEQFIGLLAHHFDLSTNNAKKREYLLKAGKASYTSYANEAAIDYFQRVIPLLEPDEQVDVRMDLGKVYERVGDWDDAENEYKLVLEHTTNTGDQLALAWCQTALSELHRKQGQYDTASMWLDLARVTFEELDNARGIGQVLHNGGTLAAQQGDFDRALDLYQDSLEIRRQQQDNANIGSLLSNMGVIAGYRSDYQAAYDLYKESLEIRRAVGDKWAIAISLSNLGNTALAMENYAEARDRLEEALALQREVGDRWYTGNVLNNLANAYRAAGEHEKACQLYKESFLIYQDLGDKWALAFLLEDFGSLMCMRNKPGYALNFIAAASSLREQIGSPLPPSARDKLDGFINSARQELSPEEQEKCWTDGQKMSLEEVLQIVLGDQCD